MQLPNKWGQGSLFAYSGLDGECTLADSIVGSLLGDALGIVFNTEPRRELRFHLKEVRNLEYSIVASDIIRVFTGENQSAPLTILFSSQDTVMGVTTANAVPHVCCESGDPGMRDGSVLAHESGGLYSVLITQETGPILGFALSMNKRSAKEALDKARGALMLDVDKRASEKMKFFDGLPMPKDCSPENEITLAKSFSVMKSQVYSPEGVFDTRWTTPDRIPHQKIWLWDSVFHSFGNRYISEDLAYESLVAVIRTQEEDGFIPIMSRPEGEEHDETQPPTLAWGFHELFLFTGCKDYLTDHYEALKRYLLWNGKHRDSNGNGLYEWKIRKDNPRSRCAECGMDNSPRFDRVSEMECIDFSCFMAKEMISMAKMADLLGMEKEGDFWRERFKTTETAINSYLWDEKDGFYYDRYLDEDELSGVKSVASFLPLFAEVCPPDRAKRLAGWLEDPHSFGAPFPIPSVSVDDATFGTDMWRGPVWINYNYMIIRGLQISGYSDLADKIRRRTLEAIAFWYDHDGCIYEFYDSTDRKSPSRFNRKGINIQPYDIRVRMQCIRDYGWTCSAFADLLLRPNGPA